MALTRSRFVYCAACDCMRGSVNVTTLLLCIYKFPDVIKDVLWVGKCAGAGGIHYQKRGVWKCYGGQRLIYVVYLQCFSFPCFCFIRKIR